MQQAPMPVITRSWAVWVLRVWPTCVAHATPRQTQAGPRWGIATGVQGHRCRQQPQQVSPKFLERGRLHGSKLRHCRWQDRHRLRARCVRDHQVPLSRGSGLRQASPIQHAAAPCSCLPSGAGSLACSCARATLAEVGGVPAARPLPAPQAPHGRRRLAPRVAGLQGPQQHDRQLDRLSAGCEGVHRQYNVVCVPYVLNTRTPRTGSRRSCVLGFACVMRAGPTRRSVYANGRLAYSEQVPTRASTGCSSKAHQDEKHG